MNKQEKIDKIYITILVILAVYCILIPIAFA